MGTCRQGKRVSRSPTTMPRQLGLAASENKKHLRQRTATIRREQTAKNATNLFRNSNNPRELGFKHLVDIEGITGSKYDARNSSSAAETGSMTGWWVDAAADFGEPGPAYSILCCKPKEGCFPDLHIQVFSAQVHRRFWFFGFHDRFHYSPRTDRCGAALFGLPCRPWRASGAASVPDRACRGSTPA
jgi:hypothetical protein